MVCFQTKNNNLGKFWRVLKWKILVYFITIWSILLLLEYFVVIWYIFRRFGVFYREKSGNPGSIYPSGDDTSGPNRRASRGRELKVCWDKKKPKVNLQCSC
jgi:hypothetical protein